MWPPRPIAVSRLLLFCRPTPFPTNVAQLWNRYEAGGSNAILAQLKNEHAVVRRRFASDSAAGKSSDAGGGGRRQPARLAKPNRYRPPSHFNSAPPRKNAHTPLPKPAHKPERSHYPSSMPDPGTVAHFFLHNKIFHALFTLTTLIALAIYVGIRDFLEGSPYGHLVTWDWWHPIASIQSFIEAYRLDDQSHSKRIMEKRRRRLEDMEKRAHYALVVEGKTGGEGWGVSVRPHPYDEEYGTVRIRGKRVVDIIAEAREKKEKEDRRARGEIVDEDEQDKSAAIPASAAVTEGATSEGAEDGRKKKWGFW